MNSLLGTALDGPQTAMMNMSRIQGNSGGSLLGACPQPIMDDQQQLQYSQQLNMSSQSQRYPQTLPSLMADVTWNSSNNVNDFRSSSLLGSLRNEGYTNPRGNNSSLASSSSILGSVTAVQDTFHLQAQNPLIRPGPGGIPSLLGPIQPLPTPQGYPRNEIQNVPSGGITSLLGSVTSNISEEPQQLKSRIPSLVETTIAQRGMEGTKSHGFSGASSILGSAMTEREARTNIEQVRTSNQTPSTIPSLLGSLSLPLMSGHQGNLRGMGQNQRVGQKNPISLLADDLDIGLENRSTMQPQGMNEDRMFSGGQQQIQQMQQMQQMQQQMREPHLQQQHQQPHQQSVHMESQMRGSGAGYSVAPGGYSMGTSGIAGDNSMTGDTYGNAYSMSGNGYSVEANNAYSMAPSSAYSMEPNSTYSIAPTSGYSMTPSNAYSMSANGVYSMDSNAHNMGPGGGSGMNVQESMCSVLMMNLPVHMGPDELKSTLYSYCISGPPADIQVPWAGVARLIFNDAQSAVATVNQMDGQNLNGHVLRVYVESYNIDQQRME